MLTPKFPSGLSRPGEHRRLVPRRTQVLVPTEPPNYFGSMRQKSGRMHNNTAAPRRKTQKSGAKGFPGQASVSRFSRSDSKNTPRCSPRSLPPLAKHRGGGSSGKKSSEKSIAARLHHQPPGQRLEVLRRRRCRCRGGRHGSLPSQVSLLPTLAREQRSAGGPLPGPLPQPPPVGPAALLRCWGRKGTEATRQLATITESERYLKREKNAVRLLEQSQQHSHNPHEFTWQPDGVGGSGVNSILQMKGG